MQIDIDILHLTYAVRQRRSFCTECSPISCSFHQWPIQWTPFYVFNCIFVKFSILTRFLPINPPSPVCSVILVGWWQCHVFLCRWKALVRCCLTTSCRSWACSSPITLTCSSLTCMVFTWVQLHYHRISVQCMFTTLTVVTHSLTPPPFCCHDNKNRDISE